MAKKYVAAKVGEIAPGGRKLIEADGVSVAVFNIGGEYFALRNRCPHQGGPLCLGRLSGFIQSEVPGEYNLIRPGEILRCPWHAWEFDIRTGQSWYNPAHPRVRKYEVTIQPGQDLIGDAEMSAAGLERGPYTAEMYPVSLEEQYVVVEIR